MMSKPLLVVVNLLKKQLPSPKKKVIQIRLLCEFQINLLHLLVAMKFSYKKLDLCQLYLRSDTACSDRKDFLICLNLLNLNLMVQKAKLN